MSAFFDRERRALLGYALAITGDHQLAEDAVQEAATFVLQRPQRLPAGEPGRAWLLGVVRRKALEAARRSSRRRGLLSEDALDGLAAACAEREDDGLRSEALADCMARVPAAQRRLLVGRYRDNLSAEDLARRAGRSVQGVYAVLKRLRRALSECVRLRLAEER